jgi:hypothetical protein
MVADGEKFPKDVELEAKQANFAQAGDQSDDQAGEYQ